MRNNRIYPGAILVCLGVLFLLRTLGVLHFHWSNVLHLWPLLLVIGGINLALANNKAAWAVAVRIIVVVGCIALLVFGDFGYGNSFRNFRFNRHYNGNSNSYDFDDNDSSDDDGDDNESTNAGGTTSSYTEPMHAETKFASLNISGGITTYQLSDTTGMLITAITKTYNGNYTFDHHRSDSVDVVDFNMKGKTHVSGFPDRSNTAELKLNSKPIWDIHVKGGADKLNFDLTRFKIRNLKLDGGATDYTVKMGMPLASTNVNVSAGVSDITINVPSGAACDVTTNSGLSSNSIEGFNKVGDNHYQTANFSASPAKLYVHFNGGISDFKVNRY